MLEMELERTKKRARLASRVYDTLISNGEWDDGCFYYKKTAAPELESFMNNMGELNRKPSQGNI